MERTTVRQLAEIKEEPAISIMCPLDAGRPGNPQDPVVLAQLRDVAVEKVNHVLRGEAAEGLIARIDEAVGSVDLRHPAPGVAVLVSANVSRVIEFDAPVEPHVVVGERFAIRDLVTAMLRRSRARLVVLSLARTRCVDLTGDATVERHDFGFPVEIVPPTEADTPHGDFPLSEHEHAEAIKFVFRAVDRSLGSLQRGGLRPLVIIGTERDLAHFDEVTEQHAHIVGRVAGNHERDTPYELARLVRPVLEAHERHEQTRLCDETRAAIGTHAVSGIADVWQAARSGRGHRLLLEEDFRFTACLEEGTLDRRARRRRGELRRRRRRRRGSGASRRRSRRRTRRNPRRPRPHRTAHPILMSVARWEYRLEDLRITGKDPASSRADAVAMLDALGQDGWEVVGLSPAHASSHGLRVETTDCVVSLKRPRRGKSS